MGDIRWRHMGVRGKNDEAARGDSIAVPKGVVAMISCRWEAPSRSWQKTKLIVLEVGCRRTPLNYSRGVTNHC